MFCTTQLFKTDVDVIIISFITLYNNLSSALRLNMVMGDLSWYLKFYLQTKTVYVFSFVWTIIPSVVYEFSIDNKVTVSVCVLKLAMSIIFH